METTFGYSCRNSRSKGSGTRWLIAPNAAWVTVGRHACICSIYQASTAAGSSVTRPVASPGAIPVLPTADAEFRCQGTVGKGVYNAVRMGEPPPVGWPDGVGVPVTQLSVACNAP